MLNWDSQIFVFASCVTIRKCQQTNGNEYLSDIFIMKQSHLICLWALVV